MNGVHDMGGMHGFGKVEPEPDEPVFHAPWEARVIALQRSMVYTGEWNIDMSRAAQEGLPPHVYLGVSYYKRWALGMERNLVNRGLVERRRTRRRPRAASAQGGQAQADRRRHQPGAVARPIRPSGNGTGALQDRRPRAHQEHPSRRRTPGCRATCAAMSA